MISDIYKKFKKLKFKKSILIFILILLLINFFDPIQVYAQTYSDPTGFGKTLDNLMNDFIYKVLEWIAKVLVALIGLLLNIAQYNEFTNSKAVELGWIIVRDLSNMFFIVILMVVAISTILRIEAYNYKKMLPKLLIMAVLINFSKMFAGLLIDFSQVITLTFVDAFAQAGKGNFLTALGLTRLVELSKGGLDIEGLTSSLLAGIVFAVIAIVVVGAIMVTFLFRIIAFWILIVLSPLAFLASTSGFGQKYSDEWWTTFTKYLIVGPVLAFFLWLSLSIMSEANLASISKNITKDVASPCGSQACEAGSMAGFIISIAMLIGSLVAAQQIGAAGASAAGGALGMMKKGVIGVAKSPLMGMSYMNELQAGGFKIGGKRFKGTGITANPMDWARGWKEARELTKQKRLQTAQGGARDIFEYGVGNSMAAKFRGWTSGNATNITELNDEKNENERIAKLVGSGKKIHDNLSTKEKDLEKESKDLDIGLSNNKEELKKQRKENNKKPKNDVGKKAEEKRIKEAETVLQENYDKNKAKNKEKLEEVQGELYVNEKDGEKYSYKELAKRKADKMKEEARVKERDIKNIEKGNMTSSEAEAQLRKVNDSLEDLKRLEKNTGTLTVADQQIKMNLENEKQEWTDYSDSIKTGKTKLGNAFDPSMYNIDVTSKVDIGATDKEKESYRENRMTTKDRLKTEVAGLKKDAEILHAFADSGGINETTGKIEGDIVIDGKTMKIEDLQKSIALQGKELKERKTKEQMASRIPSFYKDSARRALEAEEGKKIADVQEAEELVGHAMQAMKSKDYYKFAAAAKKLAKDGNDNELWNKLGYDSGYNGMKGFIDKEVIGTMGVDKQRALSLTSDISYINESVGHWDTARVVSNKNGKWDWMSEEDHANAAASEIMKKDPRQIARSLNRLAYGGETPNAKGGRDFKMGLLGKIVLSVAGGALGANLKEMNPNIGMNLAQEIGTIEEMVKEGLITDARLITAIKELKARQDSIGAVKPVDYIDLIKERGFF